MERSEPTPVLPIVSTSHAQETTHVTLRRNKMMLPEYYNLKALGGSSTKLPPERRYCRSRDLHSKHSGARVQNSPQETLSSLSRSSLKALGGSSTKLPPRDTIVAIAIFYQSTRGLEYNPPPPPQTPASATHS